jgi:hypothetical protein
MAYDETLRRISLDADTSIGIYTGVPGMPGSADPNYGKQFCFVKITGEHTAGLATAATGEQVIGVLQNKPQHPANAASVAIRGAGGVSLVQVGTGGIAAGAPVKCDANGKAVTATPGTDPIYGIAVESGAAGSVAPVLLV